MPPVFWRFLKGLTSRTAADGAQRRAVVSLAGARAHKHGGNSLMRHDPSGKQANRLRGCLSAILALSSSPSLAQAEGSGRDTCTVRGARFAIGEAYTPELAERARQAARARTVRTIERGGAYTTDLNPDRLNIEVDRTGIVTDLSCG